MCGEHTAGAADLVIFAGSSPHVRGAHVTAMVHHTSAGIIPACAGSTDIDAIKRLVAGDHPRMCGEHLDGDTLNNVASGSSPHVRGAHQHDRVRGHDRGIIPACAGSTYTKDELNNNVRDHPRMCGEHGLSGCGSIRLVGSSPHVRGALCRLSRPTSRGGIIPACAGSTFVKR